MIPAFRPCTRSQKCLSPKLYKVRVVAVTLTEIMSGYACVPYKHDKHKQPTD